MVTFAYNELIREADALLYATPNPIKGKIRIPLFYSKKQHIQQMYSRQIGTDALSAYTLALAYAFSNNKVYADKSLEFLFAWIENCTGPADGGDFWDMLTGSKRGDTPIVISYHFPKFIMAFDILRGLFSISEKDTARFRNWLRPFVEYIRNYDPFLPNNHLSWKAVFLLTAGRALEDTDIFCEGLNILRYALRLQIAKDGSMLFELIRKDRASSYTLMNLEALVQAIWIAENHGVFGLRETYSIFGGNIKSACSNFLEFLLDPERWHSRYSFAIRSEQIKIPDYPSDWAWVFEIPLNWFYGDREITGLMKNIIGSRIYGKVPPRSYTMQFATLLFRKF
ncbi:alginate lyase family protein [bacterium]|nr:alginate lyase family protein [bacterium]